MTDLVPVRRALISLSDKNGLDELAAGLARHGVEIVSTGGTAAKLREHGASVRDISDLTGFPEMMDGRVKTLHPKVHGGLLGVRDNPEHAAAMERAWHRADRPRRGQPLPVPQHGDERRRPRHGHREYRHRRAVDGALGGQEPRACRDRHRSRRLCGTAGRTRRERGQHQTRTAQEARGQGVCTDRRI